MTPHQCVPHIHSSPCVSLTFTPLPVCTPHSLLSLCVPHIHSFPCVCTPHSLLSLCVYPTFTPLLCVYLSTTPLLDSLLCCWIELPDHVKQLTHLPHPLGLCQLCPLLPLPLPLPSLGELNQTAQATLHHTEVIRVQQLIQHLGT